MLFLRARRTRDTAAWWRTAAAALERPTIVGEMLRDDSVVCDAPEADAAIAWASAQPAWSPATPALWVEDPHDRRIEQIPMGVAP